MYSAHTHSKRARNGSETAVRERERRRGKIKLLYASIAISF
jgi:hypothetical protein